MIGIEAAGLWQQPQARRAETLRLQADHRAWTPERHAIRPDPHHRYPFRLIALHLALEALPTGEELLLTQLSRRRGGARHEIRDPVPQLEQLLLFPWLQNAVGESRAMQHRPKPVARPGEVVASRTGIETGIDPTEQHAQPRRNHIRYRPTRRREHLGAGRCPGLTSARS